jgi:hypothetical protein
MVPIDPLALTKMAADPGVAIVPELLSVPTDPGDDTSTAAADRPAMEPALLIAVAGQSTVTPGPALALVTLPAPVTVIAPPLADIAPLAVETVWFVAVQDARATAGNIVPAPSARSETPARR